MLGTDKPKFLEEISTELMPIEETFQKSMIGACPCHHDLKLDNLLFDGKQFWFVDWEAACQGDFLFDIATVIIFLALNAIQEDYFLETYFGEKITKMQRYHLNMKKQVVLCYYGTAYLMVAKIRYQQPPITQDPSRLPDAEIFLRGHIKNSSSSISPENIQEFGMVLLNQALKNLKQV